MVLDHVNDVNLQFLLELQEDDPIIVLRWPLPEKDGSDMSTKNTKHIEVYSGSELEEYNSKF